LGALLRYQEFSSDLWYGFRLLLIPFTLGRDPIFGMQLAGIFVIFVFLLSAYAACACLKIKPIAIDPYRVLKEDFKARYVVLAKPFDDSLRFRLDRDAGFVLKQENDRSAVFEIK
jgi:hypothetical protein